jgi:hypothetical protein
VPIAAVLVPVPVHFVVVVAICGSGHRRLVARAGTVAATAAAHRLPAQLIIIPHPPAERRRRLPALVMRCRGQKQGNGIRLSSTAAVGSCWPYGQRRHSVRTALPTAPAPKGMDFAPSGANGVEMEWEMAGVPRKKAARHNAVMHEKQARQKNPTSS